MYIKVNKRFSKKFKCQMFQFSVIESFRENGKVKHRTLLYLDSIAEKFLDSPQWAKDFLGVCKHKLEALPEANRLPLMTRLETYVSRADEAVEESLLQIVHRRITAW
jgi:hypothetical protein